MIRKSINSHITPELILNAYYQGLVPMANEAGEIGFYAFDPRGVIPLGPDFSIRRSLRQVLNRGDFRVTFDTAVLQVLQACARHGEVPIYELWLSGELIEQYLALFNMGIVHTVEVWRDDLDGNAQLIGGLYGLAIGGAFCGESMFSTASFGSQIALVHLVEHLREKGFLLLDAQMPSVHLKQFGLIECSNAEYAHQFNLASRKSVRF